MMQYFEIAVRLTGLLFFAIPTIGLIIDLHKRNTDYYMQDNNRKR
jgi:hypothetical protein